MLANGDAVVRFEKDDGCLGRLVQRERLAEVPSSLTGAEKLHEVRIQGVEDSITARAEIASDTVEAEFPCPPWRPDAEPKLKESVSRAAQTRGRTSACGKARAC